MPRTLRVSALALIVTGCTAAAADATFPGSNGLIAFRQSSPGSDRSSLFRALPDGTQVTRLTRRPGLFSDWRADGGRIAFDFFDANGNEQIATAAPDGRHARTITSGRGIHEVPSWSPEGNRIVFDYSAGNPDAPGFRTRLRTMHADGSHARPLPMVAPGFDVEPRYSPNGRWIAFDRLRTTSKGQQRQAAFIVSARGGRARQLTPWKLSAEHPTWSPHSDLITFNTPDGTIAAVGPDGRGRHTIRAATKGSGGHKPWVSPDSGSILFVCENQGLLARPPADYNVDICVMDADGLNIVNLTNTPNKLENEPSWAPAPR